MTNSNDLDLTSSAERFDSGERMQLDKVELGQWYWVKEVSRPTVDEDGIEQVKVDEWFACVVDIGSNYVEVHEPHGNSDSYRTRRVHFDNFDELLRYEPEYERVIAEKVSFYRENINQLMSEVVELTARLGVVPANATSDPRQENSNALVAVSRQVDVGAYKLALIEAKEKTLPALKNQVDSANRMLMRWLIAPTMKIQAAFGEMKTVKGLVEDRIHTLELYAGLTEEAVLVREGEPADKSEKLRVMQRRFYMDEECLVSYEAGGMDFKDIKEFDKWLSVPDNFNRILPFERCVVAFRVRRTEKERDVTNLWHAFVNIALRDADRTTFLYVRNGEQLWRVNCDFDFGEKLVPDVSEFDPSQPMMVKMFGARVDKIIRYSEWELMRADYEEAIRKREEWKVKNPGKTNVNHIFSVRAEWKEYEPFNPSSVYYDEATQSVSEDIKKYNRIAVIIQGLFDRSLVLHPHGPVEVWEPASFAANIELIYDATSLTFGDKPDFEAYRQRLNSQIDENSILTGQEDYWLRVEAEKENERQAKNRRDRLSNYVRYAPYGNPGPGRVGLASEWKARAKKAVFKWTRERQTWSYDRPDTDIPCSITVPVDNLLNVSAYQPGDFKKFFEDPRTRQEYLEWAPLLLAAEDYHAGKRTERATATSSWA